MGCHSVELDDTKHARTAHQSVVKDPKNSHQNTHPFVPVSSSFSSIYKYSEGKTHHLLIYPIQVKVKSVSEFDEYLLRAMLIVFVQSQYET